MGQQTSVKIPEKLLEDIMSLQKRKTITDPQKPLRYLNIIKRHYLLQSIKCTNHRNKVSSVNTKLNNWVNKWYLLEHSRVPIWAVEDFKTHKEFFKNFEEKIPPAPPLSSLVQVTSKKLKPLNEIWTKVVGRKCRRKFFHVQDKNGKVGTDIP